jgi:hypothetical protein
MHSLPAWCPIYTSRSSYCSATALPRRRSCYARSVCNFLSTTRSSNVEIAVLPAIEHGRIGDITLATRIANTAMLASAGIDAERSRLYIDLLPHCLAEGIPGLLEATMNSFGYEYRSDFARRYIGEGRAEGKAEARMDIILKQLALRFGPLTDAVQACIRQAQGPQLDALLEQVLTAQTLDEALAPLR